MTIAENNNELKKTITPIIIFIILIVVSTTSLFWDLLNYTAFTIPMQILSESSALFDPNSYQSTFIAVIGIIRGVIDICIILTSIFIITKLIKYKNNK